MPSLTDHHSQETVKGILMGDSGSGKTASLSSLAKEGYKLMILDFDNGLDIMASLLKDDAKALQRVWYKTCTDKWQPTAGGYMMPKGTPKAWSTGIKALKDWKEEDSDESLGGIYDWGPDTVLVIDSLSFAARAAMHFHLHGVGRLGQTPWQSDWGESQRLVTGLLNTIYSADVRCNVICTAHIRYLGGEEDNTPARGFPDTLGKALPPEVNKYFNTVLLAKVQGSGEKAKRRIRTVPDSFIGLKNTAPDSLPAELPIETGMAEVFKAITKRK